MLSKWQYHRGHMAVYTRGFVVLSAQDSSICFQLAEADVTLALKARTTANTQPLGAPIWPADVLWISCDMQHPLGIKPDFWGAWTPLSKASLSVLPAGRNLESCQESGQELWFESESLQGGSTLPSDLSLVFLGRFGDCWVSLSVLLSGVSLRPP